MRILALAALLAAAPVSTARAETLRGRLVARSSKAALEHLVVSLENGRELPAIAHEKQTLTMSQIDKTFSPNALALRAGDSISYENLDGVFHNVFSLDKANAFDLGLYKGRTRFASDGKTQLPPGSTSRLYAAAGKFQVFCNIHPDMAATVYVFDHGYFGQADKNGLFTIPAPPPGRYTLVIDGPTLDAPLRRPVEVAADAGLIQIDLDARSRPRVPQHTRKDGTAYQSDNPY